MVHSYDVGTRAWQSDPTEGWVASQVVSKKAIGDKVVLIFKLDNGEVSRIILEDARLITLQTREIKTTLADLQSDHASLPPLMNPSMLEASDDLTNLSHLNEPAGMLNLKVDIITY